MPEEPTLLQRLSDMLPWNRKKAQDREALERELQAMDTKPAPAASSAAEAMEAMRRESRARAGSSEPAPEAPSEEPTTGRALHERWRDTAKEPTSNEALRDYGRKRGH